MNDPKITLVTGANRGIGFEVCRQLARHDYTVILAGRDLKKARAVADEIARGKGRVVPLELDVTQVASVQAGAKWIEKDFGRLDVLVNNAGGNFDGANLASTVPMDFVRETLELNLISTWQVTQTMLPLLRKSRSARIVNVASGAGAFDSDIGFGLQKMGGAAPAYAVSKAAVSALTLKLAMELKESKILVNAVCPGWTATYPGAEAQGARPVADGAASVVWAVTIADDGPTGGFFRDGKRIPW